MYLKDLVFLYFSCCESKKTLKFTLVFLVQKLNCSGASLKVFLTGFEKLTDRCLSLKFAKDVFVHFIVKIFFWCCMFGRFICFSCHLFTQFLFCLTQTVQVYVKVTKIVAEKFGGQVYCCFTLQVSPNEG